MKTYFISFVKDHKNVGCCIVDGKNTKDAHRRTKKLKINPGGQAMFYEMNGSPDSVAEINRWGKDILISPEELRKDGYQQLKDVGAVERRWIESHRGVSLVCENH